MCYNGNMTNEELVKVIADSFYISFLPSADKNYKAVEDEIKLFEKYTNKKLVFNEKKFLSDARNTSKNVSEFFKKLLPEELLTMGLIELRKSLRIINSYYRNIRKKKLQGGYIRAVLEGLYDQKFKNEFNKLKIQDVNYKKPVITKCLKIMWPYKESCFVLDYLNNFFDKQNEQIIWNFSSFTDKKAIGSKRKSTYEKLNQYSAYKLYAQGEYSKLRIGLKKQRIIGLKIRNDVRKNTNLYSSEYKDNQEKQDAYLKLKSLEKSGFEEIIEKINPKSYQRIKDFSPEYREGYDKFFVPEKDRVDGWKNEKAQEKWEYDTEELDLLTDEVNKNLQIFNGSYIAYSLDDVLKTFYGYDEKETADIEKEFSKIYPFFNKLEDGKASHSIIDKIDYIKKYKDENPEVVLSIDNNEWEEIKEKRNPKVDYRKLAKLRKIPGSYIFNTYELGIINKAYYDATVLQPEKEDSISELIDAIEAFLSKNPEYRVGNIETPLRNNKTWRNIKNKKMLAMAISLDTPVGESEEETVVDILEDKRESEFDNILDDNPHSENFEKVKELFKKYFPGENEFLDSVNKGLDVIDKNLSDENCNTKEVWQNTILRDKNKKKHSYYRWWQVYDEVYKSKRLLELKDFEKKMSKLYWEFKNS